MLWHCWFGHMTGKNRRHYHCKALNSLLCADVPLRNYSLTHSLSFLVSALLRRNVSLCFWATVSALVCLVCSSTVIRNYDDDDDDRGSSEPASVNIIDLTWLDVLDVIDREKKVFLLALKNFHVLGLVVGLAKKILALASWTKSPW